MKAAAEGHVDAVSQLIILGADRYAQNKVRVALLYS
jgi:hypothetical protein